VLQPRGSGLHLGYPDPMLKEEIEEGEEEERHKREAARAQQTTDELKELMREMKQDMQDLKKTTGEIHDQQEYDVDAQWVPRTSGVI